MATLSGSHDACLSGDSKCADRTEIREAAVDPGRPDDKIFLKPMEHDVVAWVAAGKSYEDIATILALPYSTVRYHLDQARRRSRFDTVTQLVVCAARDYDMCPMGPGARRVGRSVEQNSTLEHVEKRRSS